MITAIIPCRNDPQLPATVASLRDGASHDPAFKITVVYDEDNAEPPAVGVDCIIRNEHRLGPGPSRQKGAEVCGDDWLMFCDAHMRFPAGWFDLAVGYLEAANEEDVFGTVYHSDVIFNPFWHDTHNVGGADFYFWRHHRQTFSFADLVPRRTRQHPLYEVPCVLGACYFVNRVWFERIGGFKSLTGYGSEEVWLSWMSWLTGGTVQIMGALPVTHIYQKPVRGGKGPSPDEQALNRLICLRQILPVNEYTSFCSWLPIDQHIKDLAGLMKLTRPDGVVDHLDVCSWFELQTLTEAFELMSQFEVASHQTILCDSCGRSVTDWHRVRGAVEDSPVLAVCNDCWDGLRNLGWRRL